MVTFGFSKAALSFREAFLDFFLVLLPVPTNILLFYLSTRP